MLNDKISRLFLAKLSQPDVKDLHRNGHLQNQSHSTLLLVQLNCCLMQTDKTRASLSVTTCPFLSFLSVFVDVGVVVVVFVCVCACVMGCLSVVRMHCTCSLW